MFFVLEQGVGYGTLEFDKSFSGAGEFRKSLSGKLKLTSPISSSDQASIVKVVGGNCI